MITHKSVSLADQIFDQLENDILTGAMPIGDVYTESQLSEKLGVSRTPIREALRRLEQEHMVQETGKGVQVIGITDRDAACIYEIRKRIEGLAAAEAALHATDEQLAEMKEVIDMQEFFISKGDSEKIRSMDSRFHELLYLSTGSTILADTLIALHRKVQKYRTNSVSRPGRAAESMKEHKKIYEAILAKDPAAAEAAALDHVGRARKSILPD